MRRGAFNPHSFNRRLLLALAALAVAVPFRAAAYSFKATRDGKPLHWAQMPIPVTIDAGGARDLDLERAIGAAQRAFEVWSSAPNTWVHFDYGGLTEGAPIGFDRDAPEANRNLVVWTRDAWPHEPEALAVTLTFYRAGTGELVDADILVNEERYTWGLGADVDNDLQNALTHEFGHFLGLGHSIDFPDATMFPSAPPGEIIKRDLHEDDYEGIAALYPAPLSAVAAAHWGPYRDDAVAPPLASHRVDTGISGIGCSVVRGTTGAEPAWLALAIGLVGRRRRRARTATDGSGARFQPDSEA